MKIYTKTGDKGSTSLANGKRIKKDSQVISAIGQVDELNSIIGLVIASDVKDRKLENMLLRIQNELFCIGAMLALNKTNSSKVNISNKDILQLEKSIDLMDSKLSTLKNFILPGGSYQSGLLHFSRSICRRTEINVLKLRLGRKFHIINKYLNRLSDFLFVAARYTNKMNNTKEHVWKV